MWAPNIPISEPHRASIGKINKELNKQKHKPKPPNDIPNLGLEVPPSRAETCMFHNCSLRTLSAKGNSAHLASLLPFVFYHFWLQPWGLLLPNRNAFLEQSGEDRGRQKSLGLVQLPMVPGSADRRGEPQCIPLLLIWCPGQQVMTRAWKGIADQQIIWRAEQRNSSQ